MTRDIRYALRVLRARPAFSAVAILTLALGIGANTAIFTVVNAVLLRALPFHEPDRLVLLLERTARFPTVTTSWQNYVDWRDQSRSFDAVGALRSVTMTMTGGAEPERVPAKMITAATLPILGVSPAIGRNFSPEEDRPGSAGVALLSDALWRRRFGAAQDITGRAMTLDNKPYTIVGVLPPRFQLLAAADVLLPMGPSAATLPDDRGWHPGIFPLARLKAGITLRQAQAEMDLISDRLAKQYPEFDQGVSADVKPLHDYAVQNVRQSLVLLAGAVGFVLLIACANVANLVLVRAVGRQKEIAIRTAIGASRARIARSSWRKVFSSHSPAAPPDCCWRSGPSRCSPRSPEPTRRPRRQSSSTQRRWCSRSCCRSRPVCCSALRPPSRPQESTWRQRSTMAAAAPQPAPRTTGCVDCSSCPKWRWRRCCSWAQGC